MTLVMRADHFGTKATDPSARAWRIYRFPGFLICSAWSSHVRMAGAWCITQGGAWRTWKGSQWSGEPRLGSGGEQLALVDMAVSTRYG